ncbi:hypothetical protein HOLleu_11348 [Holothuria leucospilota]|uniref:Uncharacterized protein n=1 Tax=Holothuria leucospilota TaxID=206669 RepID=A0A9Q1CG53_HOLLE|nr:hypothetical protein HOLleu_11339 [Holothuria leucospilota]KAJ8044013.1 hypothetical protein HOLleu_11348 [Holothuria leucospilota]
MAQGKLRKKMSLPGGVKSKMKSQHQQRRKAATGLKKGVLTAKDQKETRKTAEDSIEFMLSQNDCRAKAELIWAVNMAVHNSHNYSFASGDNNADIFQALLPDSVIAKHKT